MFRRGLLVTTALILAASISGAAARSAASAGSRMRDSVASRNVNDEFMCTYGQFTVYYLHDQASGASYTAWEHVAVPITGRGKTVSRIIVEQLRGTSRPNFSAGIYSNTPSGLPGNVIALGTAKANSKCAEVAISIAPTRLEDKKIYWIEEEAPQGGKAKIETYWAINPKAKQRAYVQEHHGSSSSSYTSPWSEESAGPYVRVR
jgi:hypothetical protein